MSTEIEEEQLTEEELSVVKASAYKHFNYFYGQLATTFKKLADYSNYGYAYAFQSSYMYKVLENYADKWFDLYQADAKAMIEHYFDGDVNKYVENVDNDIAHAKNIVTKIYLSFVDEYNIICQFSSNDEEFIEEVQDVVNSLDDEHSTETPDSESIKRLSIKQHVDLEDIFEEAKL